MTFSRATINKLRRSGYVLGRDSRGVWVSSHYHTRLTGERAYVVGLEGRGVDVEFFVPEFSRAAVGVRRFVRWGFMSVGLMGVCVVALRAISGATNNRGETIMMLVLSAGFAVAGRFGLRRPSITEIEASRSALRSAAASMVHEAPLDAEDEMQLPETW